MSIIYPTAAWQLTKTATGRTQQDWDDIYNAAESDTRADEGSNRLGSRLPGTTSPWIINRVVAKFAIPSPISVGSAYIVSRGVYCQHTPTSGYMYDFTSWGQVKADYGDMLGLSTLIGTWYAPQVEDAQGLWYATFNSIGCTFLESKAGGNAIIAFYSTQQPYPPPPDTFDRIWVNLWTDTPPDSAMLVTNSAPGFIWVEGNDIAWTDGWFQKRTKLGTLTGVSSLTPGYLWVEVNTLRYVDASGNERSILSPTTSISGKQAGQISISTNAPGWGNELCYIDSSGNERCTEGILPP